MKKLLVVFIFCLLSIPVFGAFGAATQWYVDGSGGATTNGGAFDSGVGSPGTDEHNTATAITITTTSTTAGTCSPACSATTHGPGNFVHIASGTGCTVGWHEITSQAAGTATFESAIAGAGGDTCVGTIGGPLSTINGATSITVSGNTVNVKDSATYTISAALTAPASGSAGAPTIMRGYHTNPGDSGNCAITPTGNGCPIVQATAGAFTMLTFGNVDMQIQNFVFDCNSQATSNGISLNSNSGQVFNMTIKSCGLVGLTYGVGGGSTATNVWVHGGLAACTAGVSVAGGAGGSATAVVSESNACPGFLVGASTAALICVYCVAANNTGASSDGFQIATANTGAAGEAYINCAAYKNGRDGWRLTNLNGINEIIVRFSWAYGNTGKAFNSTAGTLSGTQQFNWNAYESGTLTGISAGPNDITLTADPTVAGGSNNYALNNTAGGGTLLRAAAFPGSIGSSVGFLSLGPIQPAINSGSSGGTFGFVQ